VDDLGFHFFLKGLPLKEAPLTTQTSDKTDVPLSPGETLPNGKDLIDRYIEKIGGRPALARIHARRIKATVKLNMEGTTIQGEEVSWQARPDKATIKSIYSGFLTMQEGCNGETVWEIGPDDGPRVLTGTEKADTLPLYAFDPTTWKDLYPSIVCVGKALIAGRPCYKVVCTSPQTSGPTTLYFDVDSGLILRKDYFFERYKCPVPAENWASDYRPVDGILYPFHTLDKILGNTLDTAVKSIEHNPKLPAGLFDPPSAIQKILKKNSSTRPTKR
jgi:hypothetical protein